MEMIVLLVFMVPVRVMPMLSEPVYESDAAILVTTSRADVVLSPGGGWAGCETSFVVDPDARVAVAMTCNSPDVDVAPDTAEQILDLWR